MSKKFKSQASSARAANATFGSPAFGFGSSAFQTTSSLSYVAELPDLSAVSDPNVVVSLRNLGKKDSTTKAKALEELQEHVKSVGSDVEDAVLVAWVDLYPRTSIDNSRRVRQLAHSLQGSLTSSAGKRIAPHLPKAVGSWLCGLYDNDRSVARAAHDALAISFPTEEKRSVLWEVYKQSLLEYADDAILVQTSATLSDERSTSKDDAESKHARVTGSAIYMLGQLIKHSQQEKKAPPASFTQHLSEVLANRKLWELVHHTDPYLRRSACSLASICAESELELHWTAISTEFVAKGLQASQLGSNVAFTSALLALTKARPEIWTSDYHAKTSSGSRILQFFKRGSQRGAEEVWTSFRSLFNIIPLPVFASSEGDFGPADASAVAEALREGASNSDEPRQNLVAAWSSYFELCSVLQSQLIKPADREKFYQDNIAPVIIRYVDPDPKSSHVLPASILSLITKAVLHPIHLNLTEAFHKLWSDLGSTVDDKMKLSLPETSKDFTSSQEVIVKLSDRLFKIEKTVLDILAPSRSQHRTSLPAVMHGLSTMDQFNQRVVAAAISVLKNRNGKPYGAAAVLQDATSTSNLTGVGSELLKSFLRNDAPHMMQSPSAVRLVKLTASLKLPLGPLMHPLISAPELDTYGEKAFAAVLSTISQTEAASFPEMGLLVVNTLNGESSDDTSVLFSSAVLQNPNLGSSGVVRQVMQTVVEYLSPGCAASKQRGALVLLGAALKDPVSAAIFTSEGVRNQLLSKLIVLSDSPNQEISDLATKSLAQLKMSGQSGRRGSATAAVVAEQLTATDSQLPILSLLELATEELNSATDKASTLSSLLPTESAWSAALEPHNQSTPTSALSITSPLQGAIYAVQGTTGQSQNVTHDGEGLSQTFRLALYATRLLASANTTGILDQAVSSNLVSHLTLALQLINEKLTLDSANTLWIEGTGEVLDEASDVLSQGYSIVQGWVTQGSPEFLEAIHEQWNHVQGNIPTAYYNALAVSAAASWLFDLDGLKQVFPDLDADVKALHRSNSLLRSATLANCAREHVLASSIGRRTLNEIISNATEVKSSESPNKILQPLILLNILLNGDSDPLEGIQSQRLVFLMQNLVRLLEAASEQTDIICEIFKLLCAVLPAVQDIYGEHWQQILHHIVEIWEHSDNLSSDLPLLHSSLRLCQKLRALASFEEANEDLVETWAGMKSRVDAGLLSCLFSFDTPSDGVNQPRQITAELLARLLSNVEIQAEEISLATSLLSAQDSAVAVTAFGLLHQAIPRHQEDLSMELALEKQVIHLPKELLSMIVDQTPPLIDARLAPSSSKRFLLAWKLVFDHFPTASYKLREAYTADLKEAGHLPALLDYVCEIVRLTSGRPLDVSRIPFEDFDIGTDESEEKEVARLSVHIYYCSLLYIPGLVKTWYIEQLNRIRAPLESWTQKYISQSIVSASLPSVTDWAKTQDQDDNPVEVKSNVRSRELIASIAIDPESPPISIAVVLPPSYPLDSPTVTSRTRVGVSEKNWQAWLRTFQIIIFSTGSIIEGLIAFRRNTTLALKGQGECAICYSIIGTDMQTPNKKCGTCRNTFHGVCLLRWFRSSNSSTCPLCRNNFSYA